MGLDILDEENVLEVGRYFLRFEKPQKGFFGTNKEGTGVLCTHGDQGGVFDATCDANAIPTEMTSNISKMCAQFVRIAEATGLMNEGRHINGNLIRYDMQFRPIDRSGAVFDSPISLHSGLHSDSMQVEPRTFGPGHVQKVNDYFQKTENRTTEGIAVLIYLTAAPEWSGTELCLPIAGGDVSAPTPVVFKPVYGDVVIINDKTPHGVCNDAYLRGAQREGEKRILLRFTMPYDN